MIGINKGPITLALKTVISRVQAQENAKELGLGRCLAVIVQNPLSNSDGSGNTTEIMLGDRAAQPYQILPGQETALLYCERLEDLYIRKRTAAMPDAFVTVIIYQERA